MKTTFKKLALIIGATWAAQAPQAVAEKAVECKVGKQQYVFTPIKGKKVTDSTLKSMAGREGDNYTEVEWTYFKTIAKKISSKDYLKCGTRTFLKIDTAAKWHNKGDGLKIGSNVYSKTDF